MSCEVCSTRVGDVSQRPEVRKDTREIRELGEREKCNGGRLKQGALRETSGGRTQRKTEARQRRGSRQSRDEGQSKARQRRGSRIERCGDEDRR
jgi:hypothetical protein